jgi:hypothetical protein
MGGSARDKVYLAARLLPIFVPELHYKYTADTPHSRLLRAGGSVPTSKDLEEMEKRGEWGTIEVLVERRELPLSEEERGGPKAETEGVLDTLEEALQSPEMGGRRRPLRRLIYREMRGGMKGLPAADDGRAIVEYAARWLGVRNRQAGNLFAFERMEKSRKKQGAAPGAEESHPAPPDGLVRP